jgi:thioredoxin-related protein
MKKVILVVLVLLSIFGQSYAADTAPAKQDPTWLIQARGSIKAEKYDQAIQQLQAANETSSADWNYLVIVFEKNSHLIWSGQKNTIKPHSK